MSRSRTGWLIGLSNRSIHWHALMIVVPFIVLFRIVPFMGDLTIGNDYQLFSILQQLELMFCLESGSFPLYIPGSNFGEPAIASTLGQLFHPISHVSAHMPGYWEGKALDWNTLFRLISLGLAQIALFHFLRRLRFDSLASFFLSFITVYNLAMLALFRYGASLESWTGFIFLCSAIGIYYLAPSRIIGPLAVTASTYWLVCSGHPQFVYYGMLGAAFFTLILPFFTRAVLPGNAAGHKGTGVFWLKTALLCCAGMALSSAYLLPYYFDFIRTNAGRVGSDYSWAAVYPDTFTGTMNNFFQPLRTYVDGNFGGTSLFLAAALTPLLVLFRVRPPLVIWVIWLFMLTVFLHMQGERLPVHHLFWEYLPFASSLRIAGRIAMLMPVFLMLLMAWLLRRGDQAVKPSSFSGRPLRITPPAILGFLALSLSIAYALLPESVLSSVAPYSPLNIRQVPAMAMAANLLLGSCALLLFSMLSFSTRYRNPVLFVLCVVTAAQITTLLHYGTWVEEKRPLATFSQMENHKRQNLATPSFNGTDMLSRVMKTQLERSFHEPYLAKFFPEHAAADDNDEIYSLMERDRTPDRVYLLGRASFKGLPDGQGVPGKSHVKLTCSSFNRMVFEVSSSRPGFLGFAYPYSENWKAVLNGGDVPVHRANGAAHAVTVPAGTNTVEFRYWSPYAFRGMAISCVVLILIGLATGYAMPGRRSGAAVAVVSVLLGAGLFFPWHHSLYSGNNLEFEYSWDSPPPRTPGNLAYGKRTTMRPVNPGSPRYIFSSGRAVDGHSGPENWAITERGDNPVWQVDLSRNHRIGSIAVHEGFREYEEVFNGQTMTAQVNANPVFVLFSKDGRMWGKLPLDKTTLPLNITFETPITARYMAIFSPGPGTLSIGEVEVFPPGGKEDGLMEN